MSAHHSTSLHVLDHAGDEAAIIAQWTPDGRFVTVSIEGVTLLFNQRAFERFRSALAEVRFPLALVEPA